MSEDDVIKPKFLEIVPPAEAAQPTPEDEMALEFAQIEEEIKLKQASGELPPSYGDWIENVDGEALSARHREVARMLAKGLRNKDVCLRLGYTPGRVSVLMKNPKIREEVLRFQDRIFDKELGGRMAEIGPDAMDVIEQAIRSATFVKPETRLETAKWAMEKLTGKAVQKHELDAGGTLGRLIDKLDGMKDMKEVLEVGVKDKGEVTEAEFTELDPIEEWAKNNLD
jgi:hypothetical protein